MYHYTIDIIQPARAEGNLSQRCATHWWTLYENRPHARNRAG